MKTPESHIKDHCNTEYHKETGELIVRSSEAAVVIAMEAYASDRIKDELTDFLDFLLKNGYCDADVYAEPPSAIDRYMHPELNK